MGSSIRTVARSRSMAQHPLAEPFELFDSWFKEAEAKEPNDANAMALATVGPDGMPLAAHGAAEGASIRAVSSSTPTMRAARASISWPIPRRPSASTGNRCAAACGSRARSSRRRRRRRMPISPPAIAPARSVPGPRTSRGRWKAAMRWRRGSPKFTAKFGLGAVPRPPHWSGFRVHAAPHRILGRSALPPARPPGLSAGGRGLERP